MNLEKRDRIQTQILSVVQVPPLRHDGLQFPVFGRVKITAKAIAVATRAATSKQSMTIWHIRLLDKNNFHQIYRFNIAYLCDVAEVCTDFTGYVCTCVKSTGCTTGAGCIRGFF